jgi:hypothetical protein
MDVAAEPAGPAVRHLNAEAEPDEHEADVRAGDGCAEHPACAEEHLLALLVRPGGRAAAPAGHLGVAAEVDHPEDAGARPDLDRVGRGRAAEVGAGDQPPADGDRAVDVDRALAGLRRRRVVRDGRRRPCERRDEDEGDEDALGHEGSPEEGLTRTL